MFIRVCVSKHIGPAAHGDKSQVALEYIGKIALGMEPNLDR